MLSLYNERTQSVWEKLTTGLMYDKQYCFYGDTLNMFEADKGLFASIELHNLQSMRAMDTDFGILPNPMYDENQQSYYSIINATVAAMMVVPTDCPNTERLGYVLDVMGAESKNVLTPAYIEVYLKGKTSRDNESEATLDIIFNNIRYDLGRCYNWGSIGTFLQTYFASYGTDLASKYKSAEKTMQIAMDRAIAAYLEKAD